MDTGIIVDLETTGIDAKIDKIIEIALLEFKIDSQNKMTVANSFSALQDPGIEISSVVTQLTGITQDHVAHQQVDWNFVANTLQKASIVIAHNAEFEKSFLKQIPELQNLNLHWGCSFKHVSWRKKGFKSLNLSHLACDNGFLNPFPHRALFDCATTFKLIEPYISELVQKSYEKEYILTAQNTLYEWRDKLRSAGFRWSSEERCWGKTVFESELETEKSFLAELYQNRPGISERLVL